MGQVGKKLFGLGRAWRQPRIGKNGSVTFPGRGDRVAFGWHQQIGGESHSPVFHRTSEKNQEMMETSLSVGHAGLSQPTILRYKNLSLIGANN
jgi:hypothetical protein